MLTCGIFRFKVTLILAVARHLDFMQLTTGIVPTFTERKPKESTFSLDEFQAIAATSSVFVVAP